MTYSICPYCAVGWPQHTIGVQIIRAAKEGSYTNTQRLIHWHDNAIDPPGDCRSDLWFVYNLGKRLKKLYAQLTDPKDQAIKHLTWDCDYDQPPPTLPDGRPSHLQSEPDANKIMREINGYHVNQQDNNGKSKQLSGFSDLKDDGSTACGCWIHSGIFPEYHRNRARERTLPTAAQPSARPPPQSTIDPHGPHNPAPSPAPPCSSGTLVTRPASTTCSAFSNPPQP